MARALLQHRDQQMSDPNKKPTRRMKRVVPADEHPVVGKIAPTPKRPPRETLREEVVADDRDPRRERG